MCAAKAITRVPVADLCCLWAETPAAPMNIALIGIFDGGALTGPGGQVRIAAIRSFIAARLDRARCCDGWCCPPGPGRAGWPGSTRSASASATTLSEPHPGGRSPARTTSWTGAHTGR